MGAIGGLGLRGRVPPRVIVDDRVGAADGVAGLFAGQSLGRRLSGPRLQRTFAVAMLLVAVFIRLFHHMNKLHSK